MAWSGRSFVAGVIATLAPLLALVAATWLFCAGPDDYSVGQEVVSPDGSRRAILYVGMGGGAAGWCDQRLAIVPSGVRFDPHASDDGLPYVFSVSCGSSVTLEWVSDDRLRVAYSLGEAVTAFQSSHTKDNAVAIEYVIVQ